MLRVALFIIIILCFVSSHSIFLFGGVCDLLACLSVGVKIHIKLVNFDLMVADGLGIVRVILCQLLYIIMHVEDANRTECMRRILSVTQLCWFKGIGVMQQNSITFLQLSLNIGFANGTLPT